MPQRIKGDRLNTVIAHKADGSPLRARDAILDWLREGFPWDTAILRSSIDPSTMRKWLATAARAREHALINPDAKLTVEARDLIVFAKQVDQAQAEGEQRYWSNMHELARGNLSKTTTTIKLVAQAGAAGNPQRGVPPGFVELERTVKSERTLPQFRALQWILENRYGRRLPLDVRVTEVGALSDDERAEAIGDAMEHWLRVHDIDVPTELSSNGHAPTNGHDPAG